MTLAAHHLDMSSKGSGEGVLVISAWLDPEEGSLRARVTSLPRLATPTVHPYVASPDAIFLHVSEWLEVITGEAVTGGHQ